MIDRMVEGVRSDEDDEIMRGAVEALGMGTLLSFMVKRMSQEQSL